MQTVTLQFDDVYRQTLMSQVGQDNLTKFFQKVFESYFLCQLRQITALADWVHYFTLIILMHKTRTF